MFICLHTKCRTAKAVIPIFNENQLSIITLIGFNFFWPPVGFLGFPYFPEQTLVVCHCTAQRTSAQSLMCRLLVFLRYVRHIVPSGEAADMIAMTIICLMTRCVTVYVKKTLPRKSSFTCHFKQFCLLYLVNIQFCLDRIMTIIQIL